jgi:hypothetical protein
MKAIGFPKTSFPVLSNKKYLMVNKSWKEAI